jgi:hypothetical protein
LGGSRTFGRFLIEIKSSSSSSSLSRIFFFGEKSFVVGGVEIFSFDELYQIK